MGTIDSTENAIHFAMLTSLMLWTSNQLPLTTEGLNTLKIKCFSYEEAMEGWWFDLDYIIFIRMFPGGELMGSSFIIKTVKLPKLTFCELNPQ